MSPKFVSVLLATFIFGATAIAAPATEITCAQPSLQKIIQKLDDRADRATRASNLNLDILKDRRGNRDIGNTCTYAATALVTIGIAAVGAYAGMSVGYLAAGSPVTFEAGLLPLLSGAFVGGIVSGGGSIYALTTVGGGPAGFRNAPDGGPLSGAYSPTPQQIEAVIDEFLVRFQNAHYEIGRLAMAKETRIERKAAWYHIGWDEKRIMDNMIDEGEAHDSVYSVELHFLETSRKAVHDLCASM